MTDTIWTRWEQGAWLIVPTNTVLDKRGKAVMGAGVAKEAAERDPGLQKALGQHIRNWGGVPYVCISTHFICLPTKREWWKPAQTDLIKLGVWSLARDIEKGRISGEIVSPYLGCGRGGLTWGVVRPLVQPLIDLGVEFYGGER